MKRNLSRETIAANPKSNPRETLVVSRVGQNRICTPYMAVCTIISPLRIPYIHRIYLCMYGFGQP
jgi:hypothetical protein